MSAALATRAPNHAQPGRGIVPESDSEANATPGDVPANRPHAPVLWLITDGKPGHRNQLEGLRAAMERLAGARGYWLNSLPSLKAFAYGLVGRFPPGDALPDPDFVVVAGHRAHASGLAARRGRGGRLVVLMRPSLPLSWFDLCVVPMHDPVPERANVIRTEGVLNAVRWSARHDPGYGLILIGGPSRHHGWDASSLVDQIGRIVACDPGIRWTLTGSRRTPPDTLDALRNRFGSSMSIRAAEETPPGWVGEQLAVAGQAWVSEDSVSMVFEALGSGAATGLLDVPRSGPGRVAKSIDHLVAQGMAMRFAQWRTAGRLAPPPRPLDEAARVARRLVAALDERGPVQ